MKPCFRFFEKMNKTDEHSCTDKEKKRKKKTEIIRITKIINERGNITCNFTGIKN